MSSLSNQRRSVDGSTDAGAWRISCITPSRPILDELTPALVSCFPGASLSDLRHYPSRQQLEQEFEKSAPNLCVVDVISDRERALPLLSEILKISSGINVLALLAGDEPDLIVKCLRLGAREFLIRPFGEAQLRAALPKLIKAGPEPRAAGKIYCVIPAKGACGASTVACNVAFQWKRLGSKVLLADMDPLTGTLSFLLKLKSAYSFIDVLQRAGTLDADLWRAMVIPSGGVDVLLAPELLIHGINEMTDASPILDFARRSYETVILDAGSAYGEWNLSQARASDEILLVTTNELPALHGAQRSISYLEANHIPKWKIRVIINRYDKKVGLDKAVIASALHVDVVHTIPSDFDTVQKSLINGKPITGNSGVGKEFAALGDLLAAREKPTVTRTAPFGGLFSLFSRTSF